MCIGNDNLYVSDEKHGDILIVCKVVPAKAVLSARIHILTVENCVAMCFVSNYLVVLHQDAKNCSTIMLLSFTFPPRKSHTMYISHNVISSFVPACEIKGLLSVFNSEVCFGGWSKDNAVYFFKESKKKWIGSATTCTSSTRPCTNFQSLLSVNNSNEILLYQLDVKKQNVAIGSKIRTVKVSNNVSHIFLWGKVIYLLRNKDANAYQLEEHGPLDFGLRFCKALNDFYNAISYIPPGTTRHHNLNLEECIEVASNLQTLFNSMQQSLEKKYPTRHSFAGADGVPFTEIIECIDESLKSWDSFASKAESF